MTRFSPKFKTFSEWKAAHNYKNKYTERIIREHKSYPKANLSQLRGHHGKRKPLSQLKSKKERKKSKKMQIVISGNIVKYDRTYTMNMYTEFYTRSTRSKEQIADEIFQMLKDRGLRMYNENEEEPVIIVNFREELLGNKGKAVSQKKAKELIIDRIESSLKKPDRVVEREKEKERRRMEREKRRQQKQEEKKKRYDNNEW